MSICSCPFIFTVCSPCRVLEAQRLHVFHITATPAPHLTTRSAPTFPAMICAVPCPLVFQTDMRDCFLTPFLFGYK